MSVIYYTLTQLVTEGIQQVSSCVYMGYVVYKIIWTRMKENLISNKCTITFMYFDD